MTIKKRFDNNLTEAQFKTKVIGALRQLSRRRFPKSEAIGRARVKRGVYKCELCGTEGPRSLPPLPGRKRKRKNIQADHLTPIVGQEGFTSYDDWIERCFVPAEGFQAICWKCHSEITKAENAERRKNKTKQQKKG